MEIERILRDPTILEKGYTVKDARLRKLIKQATEKYYMNYGNYSGEEYVEAFSAHLEAEKAFKKAEDLLLEDKELPPEIIDAIAKVPRYAEQLGELLIDFNKDVPTKIKDSIKWHSDYSNNFIAHLIEKDKDVPQEFIEKINGGNLSRLFFKYLERGKTIPPEVLDNFRHAPTTSLKVALKLIDMGKEIPLPILEGIGQDHYDATEFADYLLEKKGEVAPEPIIRGLLKDSFAAGNYAVDLAELDIPVPQLLIDGLDPFQLGRYKEVLRMKFSQQHPGEDLPDYLDYGS